MLTQRTRIGLRALLVVLPIASIASSATLLDCTPFYRALHESRSSDPAPAPAPSPKAEVAEAPPPPPPKPRSADDDTYPQLGCDPKLESCQRTLVDYRCEDAADDIPNRTDSDSNKPTPSVHERCLPSCYHSEPVNPEAGKASTGCTRTKELLCEKGVGGGHYGDPNLYDASIFNNDDSVYANPSCAMPRPAGGRWAKLQAFARQNQSPGEVLLIPPDQTWTDLRDPEGGPWGYRCIAVESFRQKGDLKVTRCGTSNDKVVCEAAGSATVRAANVIHYRLEEAKKLQAAGNNTQCQQAALEAIALSRGLPVWRERLYKTGEWARGLTYKTRWDGQLSEEAVVAKIGSMGREAQRLYSTCGGPPDAPTTVAQEQSFHGCW